MPTSRVSNILRMRWIGPWCATTMAGLSATRCSSMLIFILHQLVVANQEVEDFLLQPPRLAHPHIVAAAGDHCHRAAREKLHQVPNEWRRRQEIVLALNEMRAGGDRLQARASRLVGLVGGNDGGDIGGETAPR